jgi:hypothetical protein
MKKIFINKKLIIVAFFTVFSIGSVTSAIANDGTNPLPVELKFIGNIKNQPLFQLSFAGNAEENDFTITIRDEEGNALYSENIKGENFYKKFLLNSEETGSDTLRFEVISKKSGKSVVFEINPKAAMQDMVVNKTK